MNTNFIKSSVKALAVALAALAFTSCSKDQFTEKDALNLELQRLRAQRTIDSIQTLQERQDRNALARYQRVLDSLDRENAGGRVFYSVNVVSATSAVISNGRVEEAEGVTGATVTAQQFGRVSAPVTTVNGIATFELRSGEATVSITAPNHTSADYTVNLTAPFSGYVGASSGNTVTIAKNGTTVYVGNVLPLFYFNPTDAAGSGSLATIRGRAFIETDLTNDTEETVSTTVPTGSNPGTTSASAAIAAANGGTAPNIFVSAAINSNSTAFRARYLDKVNDQTTSVVPGTPGVGGGSNGGRMGMITKLFYTSANAGATGPATTGAAGSATAGSPVTRTSISATGDYVLTVPSSAAGLPIVMKSDEIAANRTYFRDADGNGLGAGTRVTQRFLYGPNVAADGVPAGTASFSFNVQAFTTAATATASYVAGTTATAFTTGAYGWGTTALATAGVANSPTIAGGVGGNGVNGFAPFGAGLTTLTLGANYAGGYYGVAPSVTLTTGAATAPTTVATGAAIMGGTNNATLATSTAPVSAVAAVNVTAGGAGYAVNTGGADVTASFNRTDLFTIGTANKVLSVGGTINTTLQVTDGGFGFIYPAPAAFDGANVAAGTNGGFTGINIVGTAGSFTGILPAINFTVLAGQTAPSGVVIPDLTTGTIAGINMATAGNNLGTIPASLGAVLTNQNSGFVFGPNTSGVLPDQAGGVNLIVSSATAGVPQFNTTANAAAVICATCAAIPTVANRAAYQLPNASVSLGAGEGDIVLAANTLTARTQLGAAALTGDGRYVFVPTISFVGRTTTGATLAGTAPTLAVTVTTSNPAAPFTSGGLVTSVTMAGGSFGAIYNGTLNAAPIFPAGITSIGLNFATSTVPAGTSRTQNSLSANVFGSGTGIDNYVFNGQGGTAVTVTGTTALSLANGTFNITGTTIGTDGVAPANGATLTAANGLGTGTLTANQAGNLLSAARWLVVFETPAGAPNIPAWGIPVFSGAQLVAVRIVRPGAGYPVNATSGLGMMLVPNPFFSNPTVAAGAAPFFNGAPVFTGAPVATGTNFDANFNLAPNTNVRGLLPNAGSIGIELRANAAALVFTLTNAGAGYTSQPTAVVFDAGLTFAQVAQSINGNTTNSTVPVTMAGNAAGGLLRVGGTTNPAGITLAAGQGSAILTNTSVFTNPQVLIVDALSQSLTTAMNTAAVTNLFSVTAAGGLTGFDATLATQVPFVRIPAGTLTGVSFNQIPVVTVSAPTGGTAATLVIPPLSADPNISGFRVSTGVTGGTAVIAEIARINITNGGSGYSFGNRYQRFVNTLAAGQNYVIIGSNRSTNGGGVGSPGTGTSTGPQLGVDGSAFEVMTGVTYVRDIHYGTGLRID